MVGNNWSLVEEDDFFEDSQATPIVITLNKTAGTKTDSFMKGYNFRRK
jgi:hypothetical protein